MAYMSQQKKKELAPAIREWCKMYGVKATIAVDNHSTLVVNIKSGRLPFCQNWFDTVTRYPKYSTPRDVTEVPKYLQVNPYWFQEHFGGTCRDFLKGLIARMNKGNHDNSDIMTDYFDVGWYISVNIGQWDKPYEVTK